MKTHAKKFGSVLAGALCVALLTGCGDSKASTASGTTTTPITPAKTASPTTPGANAIDAAKAAAQQTGDKLAATAADAEAALADLRTQEELDAEAAAKISAANADKEFEALAAEIDNEDD